MAPVSAICGDPRVKQFAPMVFGWWSSKTAQGAAPGAFGVHIPQDSM